jgi:hypothetical protein
VNCSETNCLARWKLILEHLLALHSALLCSSTTILSNILLMLLHIRFTHMPIGVGRSPQGV